MSLFTSFLFHRLTLISILASIFVEGLSMTGSSSIPTVAVGLVLTFFSGCALWWFFLSWLSEKEAKHTQEHPALLLVGGWVTLFIFCFAYGWLVLSSTSAPQVSSTGQSGGITAGNATVHNYYAEKKPHPYSLSDKQIALLAQRMTPYARSFDNPDFIFCIMGSPDSGQLTTDLVKAFRTAGWIIPSRDGFSSNLFQKTPKGIFIQVPPGDKYPPGYREFILTLKEFGIVPPGKVQGASNPALPPNQFQIIVGTRP